MIQYLPPPDYRSLLPPLLACLPTAFVSPRPPPALLPLLSPILRQRVQLLGTASASSSDSWLPLLCWESEPAKRLVDLVSESNAFELHPVSGEIDFGEVEDVGYRRLDEETLQARIVLPDMGLLVIYLWCEGDQEGGGNGWRVSEVRPLVDDTNHTSNIWNHTISQADEQHQTAMMDNALRYGEENSISSAPTNGEDAIDDEDNNDDDYWAQYDKTPGPAAKSPAPRSMTNRQTRSTSEADYFDQYAQVQPEMDNDDPSEDREELGESSLNGNVIAAATSQQNHNGRYLAQDHPEIPDGNGAKSSSVDISQPRASSPRSRSSTVSRLEESADSQSLAEVAVKQHISTSIKSLYRLCRSTGVEMSDFDRMVRTELETLSMMSEDD